MSGIYEDAYHSGYRAGKTDAERRAGYTIVLMGEVVETQKQRIEDLLKHNNELLARARTAEGRNAANNTAKVLTAA